MKRHRRPPTLRPRAGEEMAAAGEGALRCGKCSVDEELDAADLELAEEARRRMEDAGDVAVAKERVADEVEGCTSLDELRAESGR